MDGMKEKKVLIVILAVALVLMPYYYLYKPKQAKNEKAEQEISILQDRYDDLMLKVQLKKALDEDIAELNAELDRYNEQYPARITQEEIVMLMQYIYKATNIKILSVALAPFEVYYGGSNSGNNTDASANGENVSSDQSISTTDNSLNNGLTLSTEEIAYVTSVSINYKGSYTEVLDFFKYLRAYPEEIKLSTITMAYDQEQSEFSGEIKINLYVIASGDRIPDPVPEYPGVIGKDSIISSWVKIDKIEGQEQGQIASKSKVELYLSLTSPYADMAPVMIGVKGDTTGKTEAKVNNNEPANITIELSSNNNEYFVDYIINGTSNGKLKLKVDSSIDIDVYSQKRADKADKTGAITTINNTTKLPVNVNVYNDDTVKPRFELKSYTGDVNVVKH